MPVARRLDDNKPSLPGEKPGSGSGRRAKPPAKPTNKRVADQPIIETDSPTAEPERENPEEDSGRIDLGIEVTPTTISGSDQQRVASLLDERRRRRSNPIAKQVLLIVAGAIAVIVVLGYCRCPGSQLLRQWRITIRT